MTKYLIIKMYQNILIYFIQSMLIVLSSILMWMTVVMIRMSDEDILGYLN